MNTTRPDMYQMLKIVEEWKLKHHSDKTEVVFQDKQFLTNIRFNQNSLNVISKNSKGFENLPGTLENPNEIWSSIENEQIKRNYITFGKPYSYIVQTKSGLVENAFLTTSADKYRKGVWLT